jgi:PPK2 family polyphosphate:nucleotide phosphotransferase
MKLDVERFRVTPGKRLRLRDHRPGDTRPFPTRKEPLARMREGLERLADLQELLYAQNRYALLLIFQAMDAAGKDSAIRHVMRGLGPQATQVFSFKAPSAEELDHDFMWRALKVAPERGRIGVFNRSYYEEVLVVRVRPELLARQPLPPSVVTPDIWTARFEDIRNIERYLVRNGIVIRKFFLHVSRDEQRERFLERIEDPTKNWKFSLADLAERDRWQDYMAAYEDALSATSTDYAPWYVIPADRKWFTRLAIVEIVIRTLESLELSFPAPDAQQRAQLAEARRRLSGGVRRAATRGEKRKKKGS